MRPAAIAGAAAAAAAAPPALAPAGGGTLQSGPEKEPLQAQPEKAPAAVVMQRPLPLQRAASPTGSAHVGPPLQSSQAAHCEDELQPASHAQVPAPPPPPPPPQLPW